MKKRNIALIVCVCLMGMTACGKQQSGDGSAMESDPSETSETVNYESYSGNWSVDGLSHEEIIAEGGTELSCTILNGNEFTGNLFTEQSVTERFASVEEITGTIENDELFFNFSDDGWGGKGKLHILFEYDRIIIETQDYQMAEDNLIGYGINGCFEMIRVREQDQASAGMTGPETDEPEITEPETIGAEEVELTYEEMMERFSEQFYGGNLYDIGVDSLLNERLDGRFQNYHESAYYGEIIDYWENVRGVRDISNLLEPLYFTDMKYYTEEDFRNDPPVVIHLAKNEIYAKHGYIFQNDDLNNYFLGCAWYQPLITGEQFDDSVFNEYERANLKLLAELEKEVSKDM